MIFLFLQCLPDTPDSLHLAYRHKENRYPIEAHKDCLEHKKQSAETIHRIPPDLYCAKLLSRRVFCSGSTPFLISARVPGGRSAPFRPDGLPLRVSRGLGDAPIGIGVIGLRRDRSPLGVPRCGGAVLPVGGAPVSCHRDERGQPQAQSEHGFHGVTSFVDDFPGFPAFFCERVPRHFFLSRP